MERIPTRPEIIQRLQLGETRFSFEKADGTVREMRATLAKTLIPEAKIPKNFQQLSKEEVVRCFDLDKEAWRSFTIAKLREWDV